MQNILVDKGSQCLLFARISLLDLAALTCITNHARFHVIDIHTEDLEPLKAAKFPGNPHYSTRFRWATKGVRGVVLETAVVGGVRYTSAQARQRFCEQLTEAHNNGAASPTRPFGRTLRQRKAAIERAEKELAEAGI
jgi:hypothetical protein